MAPGTPTPDGSGGADGDPAPRSTPQGRGRDSVGWKHLKQEFVDPVSADRRDLAGAGLLAIVARVLGGDADVVGGGASPSRSLRRLRWIGFAAVLVLGAVFALGILL